jgi:hypothetical protein
MIIGIHCSMNPLLDYGYGSSSTIKILIAMTYIGVPKSRVILLIQYIRSVPVVT